MDRVEYLDFEIKLEKRGQRYAVSVIRSPAGEAEGEFVLPFSDLELENLLLKVGRTRRGVRRIGSPEWQAARAFGGKLFEAVCKGDVRGCFRSSLDKATSQDKGLRIKLRLLDAPELADLPWEYLYNRPLNRFLSLSTQTPIVRYIELPAPIRPLDVKPPLHILVMVSSPSDYEELDVGQEKANLQSALSNLEQRGMVELEWLEEATLRALQRRLRRRRYHIFHFIGHGGFDERAQDGLLLLEDSRGRGRRVSGQHLGVMLHDHRTLRLAVLNACEGARSSRTDPFAGVAMTLVQQGIPAVVAMQFEITDEAAIVFAREFYAAIADGYPVDASLAEARKAIFATGNDVEWGTPVLYMRSPDGVLFDVTGISIVSDEDRRAEMLYQEGMAELERKQWQDALYKFDAVLKIRPNHKDAVQGRKEALYHRGNSLLQEGEYEKAIYDFDAIIKIDPIFEDTQDKRANALCDWGIALRQAERFEEAIYKFEAILKAVGRYKDTEMKLTEARREKRLSDLYAEALQHFNAQHWREAIKGFEAVLEMDHTYRDIAALLEEARHQKALAELYAEARQHMDAGKWPEALKQFEEIQRLEPDYRETREVLAQVRQQLAERDGERASKQRYRTKLRQLPTIHEKRIYSLLEEVPLVEDLVDRGAKPCPEEVPIDEILRRAAGALLPISLGLVLDWFDVLAFLRFIPGLKALTFLGGLATLYFSSVMLMAKEKKPNPFAPNIKEEYYAHPPLLRNALKSVLLICICILILIVQESVQPIQSTPVPSLPSSTCDPYEPNNAPPGWGPLVSGQNYQAKLCWGDSEDWYHLIITSLDDIAIDLDVPPSVDYHMWLYHESDTAHPVGSSAEPGKGADEHIDHTPTATGTYYIRVRPRHEEDHDDVNSYTLVASFR